MEHLVWDIDPVAISLGRVNIRWYGILFASAFVFCFNMMEWIYKRENRNPEDLDRMLWYTALGTIVGARLAHCLIYDPAYYLSNPLEILAIWKGGLASHGANIGILLALYLFKLKTHESYLWLIDRVAIPCAMGAAFIRMGNFFNSEILGIPTSQAWGIIFAKVDNLPRHPVQLYESFSYATIFFILLTVYKKTYDKPIRGLIFGLFTSLVFLVRFVLEFFKIEQANYSNELPFSTGQLLSIPFFLFGISFIIWSLKKTENTTS